MILVIAPLFTALFVWTAFTLSRIRIRRLGFSDGIVMGLAFFLLVPISYSLSSGVIYSSFAHIHDFDPYKDIGGTATVFIGWATILSAWWIDRAVNANREATSARTVQYRDMVKTIILLYFLITLYTLSQAGYGSADANWHSSVVDLQATSTSYLIAKSFEGAFRVAVYGALIAAVERGGFSSRSAFFIGAIVATFDVLTSFNRIGLVYFALMVFIVNRKHWKLLLLLGMLSFSPAKEFSQTWAAFRGRAFAGGVTLGAITQAWAAASQSAQILLRRNDNTTMEVIFEASNIASLNFVVEEFDARHPYLLGSTFLLRPLTTFIPSTLWPGKPKVFGNLIGKYGNDQPEQAINSTLFGEPYGNFGPLFPIPLVLYILVFSFLYRNCARWVPGLSEMGCFIGFAVWRFDANFASIGLYGSALLFFASMPMKFSRRVSFGGSASARSPKGRATEIDEF